MADKTAILSVGIDVGTSTTQVVFSKLQMDNAGGYFSVPRVAIVDKEVVYKSEVYMTPLKTDVLIDTDALRDIVAAEFRKAGYRPEDTDSGAVIITGESARKENSDAVLKSLSDFAGDFVVSAAGPDMESLIAGKGSGAWQYSMDHHCRVANLDIGGGTSDIAVISLSGVVESASIKVAGDQFNEAVVKYMRRKHNLLVGERTAEQMKMQIGCVFPPEEEMTMEVKGRSLITGLPELISVSSAEMLEAFEEPVERIMEEVHLVLEKTPPELVADISNNGIVMTGGGSLVRGFDKLVTARTGIHAMVAENAIQCVAEGTGKSLDSIQDMQDGTMNLSRRKQIN